jgi:glycosyltransferase involved in cell wall biosynthesis
MVPEMKMPKSRNVFVLCTGRNGSLGFARACGHFTNYTAGHETRKRELGEERLNFPASHIEVDNRLAWFLGRLEEKYGDDAVYVHLRRDPDAVAQSYNKRWDYWGGIVSAYAGGIVLAKELGLDVARDMVRTIDENIKFFLKGKTRTFSIDIENIENDFAVFSKAIGAKGNMEAALAEFRERHNPSRQEIAARPTGTENTTVEVLGGLHAIVAHMRDIDRERKANFRNIQTELNDKIDRKNLEIARRLDEIVQRNDEIVAMKIELSNAEKKAKSDTVLAKKNASALKLQSTQLRQSREYKVGLLVERAFRKPSRFLVLPFKINKMRRKTVASKSLIADPAPLELPKDISLVAFRLLRTDGLAKALASVSVYDKYSVARDLLPLLSAEAAPDDVAWLDHFNVWLGYKGASTISLAAGEGSRFSRIVGSSSLPSKSGPKVSVIMPAYNSANTLKQAAQSILSQTWQNLELIIVDDCSTDATLQVARQIAGGDARVKVIQNRQNAGPYVSKNCALQIATGEFTTGHDADDWALPERLEKQIQPLLASEGPGATIAYMLRLSAGCEMAFPTRIGKVSFDGASRLASISLMFPTAFVREHLGYWDSVRFGGDSEFISRARLLFGEKLLQLEQISMLCLDHENSLTNHEQHGVHKELGVTGVRKDYRDSWVEWHKNLSKSELFLPFPLDKRPFSAPPEMVVPAQWGEDA